MRTFPAASITFAPADRRVERGELGGRTGRAGTVHAGGRVARGETSDADARPPGAVPRSLAREKAVA